MKNVNRKNHILAFFHAMKYKNMFVSKLPLERCNIQNNNTLLNLLSIKNTCHASVTFLLF